MPFIHLNGNRPEELMAQYMAAGSAIGVAIQKFCDIDFNARNYYPLGDDAWRMARDENARQLAALNAAQDYVLAHCEHIQQFIKE